MKNVITPFIKPVRTQGGTIFTFNSAIEDIGLNINERNNVVKISNFALLNIPISNFKPSNSLTEDDENFYANYFNPTAINGAYEHYDSVVTTTSPGVLLAESFQNYALNLETNLLAQNNYNPALLSTVSERVFWKWLKEMGAIRFEGDNPSSNNYFIEETSHNAYNTVVNCIGEIYAGAIRTNNFGSYNETYVFVPTSYGKSKVLFKQNYDENYYSNFILNNNNSSKILGHDNYTDSLTPSGLTLDAFMDINSTPTSSGTATLSYKNNNGYESGWWYTAQNKIITGIANSYLSDDKNYILNNGIINNDWNTLNTILKYTDGNNTFNLIRSNVDALQIEFNKNLLSQYYGIENPIYVFDELANNDNYTLADKFNFNAVLIYYTVYNESLNEQLATNLLGVLFLDNPITKGGVVNSGVLTDFLIPTLEKKRSIADGFGNSYSFRVNIKTTSIVDDTDAIIVDDSTSAQNVVGDYNVIFNQLSKSIEIMNSNTNALNYIEGQYNEILNFVNILNKQIINLNTKIDNISNSTTEAVASTGILYLGEPFTSGSWRFNGTINDGNYLYLEQFDPSTNTYKRKTNYPY